jgi:hypothetical protein
MRIPNEIIMKGRFWLPEASDKIIDGEISIEDGGHIHLSINGKFDDVYKQDSDKYDFKRIIGIVEGNKYITLDECFYTYEPWIDEGFVRSTLHVSMIFLKVHYAQDETPMFDTFYVSVEGLNEWVNIKSVQIDRDRENNIYHVEVKRPEEIVLYQNQEVLISLVFSYEIEVSKGNRETKIITDVQFKLKYNIEVEYMTFSKMLYQIVTFLCLCKGDIVCINSIIAHSNSLTIPVAGSSPVPENISVYYATLPFKKKNNKKHVYQFLFSMKNISERISTILNNWFNLFEKINVPIHVYFTTLSEDSMNMNIRFLLYSQCLEAFHRKLMNRNLIEEEVYNSLVEHLKSNCPQEHKSWLTYKLYGNEIFLLERLEELYKELDFILDGEIIRDEPAKIKNTRNYLTHFDEKQKKKAILDSNLYFLGSRIRLVFLFHMLQLVGFDKDEIEKAVSKIYEFKQILNRKI